MDFADRVTTLAAEGAYYMLGRAQALEATGREIIHLEVGQPDVPTFEHISQAGIDAIEEGYVRYTPSARHPGFAQGDRRRRRAQARRLIYARTGGGWPWRETGAVLPYAGIGPPR